MRRSSRRFNLHLAIIVSLTFVLGCSNDTFERVPVAGTVTIDNEPLKFGYIRFIPAEGGRPSTAEIGIDGGFYFGDEGVVVGKHRIEVIASEQVGESGYRWHAPEKYASYTTSELEREITEPTSDLALDLTWDGGKPFTVKGGPAEADPKRLKNRQP
jgi:hypothetical protein